MRRDDSEISEGTSTEIFRIIRGLHQRVLLLEKWIKRHSGLLSRDDVCDAIDNGKGGFMRVAILFIAAVAFISIVVDILLWNVFHRFHYQGF